MGNHVTDDERNKRIKRVLELISSGMSYRECADYLTKHEFNISHVTVKDYIERAKGVDSELYNKCLDVINENTPKTTNDEEVQKRIKIVYQLLKANYTFEEIAKVLNTTVMVVYRDFNRMQQMPKGLLSKLGITKETLDSIQVNLTERSLNNLKK